MEIGVKEVDGKMVTRTHSKNGDDAPDEELEPFGLFEPLAWLITHSHRYVLKEKVKKHLRVKQILSRR